MDSAAKNGSVSVILSTGLWLLVMAAALKLRPFLPVDETRYLAVPGKCGKAETIWSRT